MPETNLVNNWLFAAMSEADQDTLRPSLVRQALTPGGVLFRTGDALDLIHFPVSAQIANVMVFGTGESLAVSTVGREGSRVWPRSWPTNRSAGTLLLTSVVSSGLRPQSPCAPWPQKARALLSRFYGRPTRTNSKLTPKRSAPPSTR